MVKRCIGFLDIVFIYVGSSNVVALGPQSLIIYTSFSTTVSASGWCLLVCILLYYSGGRRIWAGHPASLAWLFVSWLRCTALPRTSVGELRLAVHTKNAILGAREQTRVSCLLCNCILLSTNNMRV